MWFTFHDIESPSLARGLRSIVLSRVLPCIALTVTFFGLEP